MDLDTLENRVFLSLVEQFLKVFKWFNLNLESSIHFDHELKEIISPPNVVQHIHSFSLGSRAEVLGGQTQRLPLDGIRGDRSAAADDTLLREARVLTLPVAPQIHLPLERLLAEAAAERLVAGVFTHVRDQVR